MTVISYPIPAYQNLPIEPQNYQPRRFVISGITLGQTTIVSSDNDMDYVVGQLVRLIIPPSFGCRQLNGVTAYVISIPSSTQVELDLYSQGGDPYTSSTETTKPQILGIGNINQGSINASGRTNNQTYIPASFINISPQPRVT
jgi:hypothetical protein